MLSEAKHPRCGFLTGVRNDAFGPVMLGAAPMFLFCHAERSVAK